MRPIQNLPAPTDENGNFKQHSTYQEWRNDLTTAYEQHCVFCNCVLTHWIEVEHFSPQALGIVNPLEWDNLLLACSPCNIAKKAKILAPATHYLPHLHNTHLAFEYTTIRQHQRLRGKMACVPTVNTRLTIAQQQKAQTTLDDLKLERVERDVLEEDEKMTDVRWLNRYMAYLAAQSQRNIWDTLTTQTQKEAFLEGIEPQMRTNGFFSVWYKAFEGETAVLAIITSVLASTAPVFPAPNYLPIWRNLPTDI